MDARGWLGLALLAALAAPARGADGDGFETLANGLRLAARPVKGARDAAVVLVFEVGEAHDPAGRSGLGHLLEHLFVTAPARGAARRTLEEVDARYPRGFHAHTGEGETVVAVVVPPEQLAAELAEAAARMGALAPEEEDLDRERAQILDELGAMYDRAPPLAAANRARERVFPPPPGARRGGTRAGLAAVSLALVRDRAARLYKPANAILVVAGAIDPAAALAAARAAFAPLAPGERSRPLSRRSISPSKAPCPSVPSPRRRSRRRPRATATTRRFSSSRRGSRSADRRGACRSTSRRSRTDG
jgi:zinc protease